MARQAKSAISWGIMSRTCAHVVFTAVSFDINSMSFKKYSGTVYGVKTLTDSGVIAAINETFPESKVDKLLSWSVVEEIIKRNELDFLGWNPSYILADDESGKESK